MFPSGSWKTFFHQVIPAVSAMVLFSLYTVVDGIFVAKGVGETALAAVNISLPFINLLSGVSILLSMGTATLCSFALGRGGKEEAEAMFSQTVAVILGLSAGITLLVGLFARPLAYLLGGGPRTIGYTTDYLRILCLFSVCFILSYCLEVMVKVDNSPQMAVIGVGMSCLVNVGLDALFIFVFHWGVKGAALATGLAQLASLLLFLHYFLGKRATLRFRRFSFRPKVFLRILPLGISDCSVELMLGFLTFLYNHILLARFGEESLTIYAVLAYLNLVVFMVMQGIAQGMMPLVSFAVGKGDTGSVQGYFHRCLLTAAAAGMLVLVLFRGFPTTVATLLLNQDSHLLGETVSALRQYALSFLPAGLNIVIAGYLTARGKAASSCLLSLGRGFVLLPCALLAMSVLWAGNGIWMSALLGELISLALALFLLRKNAEDFS